MQNQNAHQICDENSPDGNLIFPIFNNLEPISPPLHAEGNLLQETPSQTFKKRSSLGLTLYPAKSNKVGAETTRNLLSSPSNLEKAYNFIESEFNP
jgi:hypothetical protein